MSYDIKTRNLVGISYIASNEIKGVSYKPLHHATGNWAQMNVSFTCLTKFDANVEYPELELLGPVEYLIMEGEININGQLYGKNDYIRIENGNVLGRATEKGCTVLCIYHKGCSTLK
jgi:hypothetical protein